MAASDSAAALDAKLEVAKSDFITKKKTALVARQKEFNNTPIPKAAAAFDKNTPPPSNMVVPSAVFFDVLATFTTLTLSSNDPAADINTYRHFVTALAILIGLFFFDLSGERNKCVMRLFLQPGQSLPDLEQRVKNRLREIRDGNRPHYSEMGRQDAADALADLDADTTVDISYLINTICTMLETRLVLYGYDAEKGSLIYSTTGLPSWVPCIKAVLSSKEHVGLLLTPEEAILRANHMLLQNIDDHDRLSVVSARADASVVLTSRYVVSLEEALAVATEAEEKTGKIAAAAAVSALKAAAEEERGQKLLKEIAEEKEESAELEKAIQQAQTERNKMANNAAPTSTSRTASRSITTPPVQTPVVRHFDGEHATASPMNAHGCEIKNCIAQAANKCTRCNIVYYCGIQCQSRDWTEHKVICRTPVKAYESGTILGITCDEAATWMLRAAQGGHPDGQFRLGEMYMNGDGVEVNVSEAVKWWELAAASGHNKANYNLGFCYRNGLGTERDETKAFSCYTEAASKGNRYAQYILGDWFEHGSLIVDINMDIAVRWYQQSANNGLEKAKDKIQSFKK